MMLNDRQREQGAQIAPDGVPLHYGDVAAEYAAARNGAVVMDRSHEGRLRVTGADRLEFLHRISTNDLHNMTVGEGRGVILTQPNARIIDRMLVYNRGETALYLAGPGRRDGLQNLLQRNIFFNDDVQLIPLDGNQFVLHGPTSDDVITALGVDAATVPPMHGVEAEIAGHPVFVARRKPFSGAHWTVITFDAASAIPVWDAIHTVGATLAGAIAYNALRIGAGVPAYGRELSGDYIPLEVGLWDEVSFTKGCYTGQEIIARMESRARLAKVMVRVTLDGPTNAPTALLHEGKTVGTLTSAVTADGEHLGIAVIKNALAEPGATFTTEDGVTVTVRDLAGAPPPERMLKGN
jgi:folate-binding protein YgfZ